MVLMADEFNKSKSRYEQKLEDFLDKYKTDGEYTHTSFGPPWGKYNIPDKKLKKFQKNYKKVLENKVVKLHITEKPKEVAPLCLDLDFNFGKDHGERQYNQKIIKNLINLTNMIIKKYHSVDKKQLRAFLFEKSGPNYKEKNMYYKDGFHIVYPYLPVHKNMRFVIISELRNETLKNKIFKKLPYTNDIKDVFDMSIVSRNGWMMYGSIKCTIDKKKQGSERYKYGNLYSLTNIYDHKLKSKDINKYANKNLVRLLSVRKFSKSDILTINKNINTIDLERKIEDLIDLYGISPNKKKKKISKSKNNNNNQLNEKVSLVSSDDANIAKEVIKLLSDSRATSYDKWVRVGWTLHNIDEKTLFNEWIEFSKRTSGNNFDKKSCQEVWDKASSWLKKNPDRAGTGLATLCKWAKQDSPKKYTELLRRQLKPYLIEAESGTHYDIAKVVYQKYKYTYVCVSIKNKRWYEFQNHRWVEVESGHTLSLKISEELTNEFAQLNALYYQECAGKDGQERDICMKKAGMIHKIMRNLKKTNFKNSVLDECSKLFYVLGFEAKLDSNKDIIGFDNGVFDLVNSIFRNGTPDDFLSLSVGYDYDNSITINHPYIKKIKNYFKSVQPERDMREYLLYNIASYMDGYTNEQKFVLWTGTGSNGKSLTVEFIQLLLGNYSNILPTTVLTQKRGSSSSATPELSDKKGVRFIVIQEPEDNDQIRVGYMKELTGGDWVYARPLYKDPFRFRPQFKLLLTCNKLPDIPSTDGGTWRRIRVTPWECEFLDHDQPIKNSKKQFYKDYDLKEKMKEWKAACMWYILNEYYPKYKKEGIREPAKVKSFTNKYKKDTDIFHEYLDECISRCKDSKSTILLNDMYSGFKEWCDESYGKRKVNPKKELKEYLLSHGYKMKGNKVINVTLKNDHALDICDNLDQI